MRLSPNVPLADLTTLRLGGPVRELAVIDDICQLPDVVAHARCDSCPPPVLGSGSNVLASDDGYSGAVIRMATTGVRFTHASDGRVLATVQAGHELQALVDQTIAEGLSGIECLTGIPGTVGATPVQNVGAYGQEVADTIVSVRVWDWHDSQVHELTPAQCRFGHRTSIFKRSDRWIILAVTFALAPAALGPPLMYPAVAAAAGVPRGVRVSIADTAAAIRDVRAKKGMILDPADSDGRTVGSVFPSPVIGPKTAAQLRAAGASVNDFPDGATRVSASWLIQAAGFTLGEWLAPGVRVSTKHFTLVAIDDATATAFANAAAIVAKRVEDRTEIALTAEPDLIGHLPEYARLIDPRPGGGSQPL
jgi:UDP-N-acetylmuramate dehydrogenase